MARALRFVALAAAVACTIAPAAAADPPERVPVPSDPVAFPAGTVCPFPVLLEVTFNKQTQTFFANGRLLITGPFKTRVTNVATGESVERNAPGAIRVEENADGTWSVVGTGTTLFFFFADDLGPGQPGALLYGTGRTEETATADFSRILSYRHVGTTENLCETLA
jgi:hypothetical protein